MTTPHNPPSAEAVVPCQDCGTPTPMTGTKLCDGCWEHRRHCCIHSGLDKKPKAEPQPSAEREAAPFVREAFDRLRDAWQCHWRVLQTGDLRERCGAAARVQAAFDAFEHAALSQPAAPQACHLCGCAMPNGDHDGHGLGECVPVCEACDGSGVAPKPQGQPAAPQAPASESTRECDCGSRSFRETSVGDLQCNGCYVHWDRRSPPPVVTAPQAPAAVDKAVELLQNLRSEFGTLLFSTPFDRMRAQEAVDRSLARLAAPAGQEPQ